MQKRILFAISMIVLHCGCMEPDNDPAKILTFDFIKQYKKIGLDRLIDDSFKKINLNSLSSRANIRLIKHNLRYLYDKVNSNPTSRTKFQNSEAVKALITQICRYAKEELKFQDQVAKRKKRKNES